MKKHLITLCCAMAFLCSAQEEKSLFLKGNAALLPIGILNAGAEYQLTEKFTIQGDVLISPWKSFAGRQAQLYMAGLDGRYYFDRVFKRWYVAANLSGLRFIAQKWNHWSDGPYQLTQNSPIYNKSDLYQDGYAIMLGATVGYQFQLAQKWNLDVFLGGGMAQSFYKGYHKNLDIRYDEQEGWNRSGEWIPYRGGVMISYKLR